MTKRSLFSTIRVSLVLALCAVVPASAQQTMTPAPSPTPMLVRPRVITPVPQTTTASKPSPVVGSPVATPTPAVQLSRPPSAPTPQPASAQGSSTSGTSATVGSAANQNGVVTTASVPPPLAVPLKPVKPLAPNKLAERIEEAERLLRSRTQLTALTPKPSTDFVTIAALDPESSQIHLITVPKETFLRRDAETTLATSLGALARVRVVRSNWVNTALVISDMTGRQYLPLVVSYPIEKFGAYRETAYYTSVHPALQSPDLVRAGQSYIHTMLELAAKRLRDKGMVIDPEIVDVAERLSVVEHVDHDRFRRENRLALYEEIFALYALNELDTYRYSVSSAGAGGMVQMIPSTYAMIRRRRPTIGLNPDFVAGMRNHGNALEAMLVYMQDTWNDMRFDPDIADALVTKTATQAELLSAGYNSNPARLPGYLYRGGESWRTLIPRETQMYLQILSSLDSLVPMRKREK